MAAAAAAEMVDSRACRQAHHLFLGTLAVLALMVQTTLTRRVAVAAVPAALEATPVRQTVALVELEEQSSVSPMARAGEAVLCLALRPQMAMRTPVTAAPVLEKATQDAEPAGLAS
jgi:hypothetical protein